MKTRGQMSNGFVAAIGSLIGFFMLIMFFIVFLGLLLFIFWIWMVVDCAKRKFKNDTDKIVWILVIVFLNLVGAAIYYFVVKLNDKTGKKKGK